MALVEETDIPLLKPIVVDSSKLNLRNLGVRREIVKAPTKTAMITQEDGPSTSQEKAEPVTAADFPPEAPVTKALTALEQLKERVCHRTRLNVEGCTINLSYTSTHILTDIISCFII